MYTMDYPTFIVSNRWKNPLVYKGVVDAELMKIVQSKWREACSPMILKVLIRRKL